MSVKNTYIFLLFMFIFFSCNREKKVSPVRKTIQEAVFASGTLSQENEFYLAASYDGVLKNVSYKEGEAIQANAVFATIEHNVSKNQLDEAQLNFKDAQFNASSGSLQLKQINAQIEQAKAQVALDYKNYLRYKELHDKNSVSTLDFEKAELQYKTSSEQLQLLKNQYLDLEKISKGLVLDGHRVSVEEVSYIDNEPKSEVGLKLRTANVKVVRSIFESFEYNVLRIDRVSFAGLTKKNLPRGNWRFLTDQEVINLKNT